MNQCFVWLFTTPTRMVLFEFLLYGWSSTMEHHELLGPMMLMGMSVFPKDTATISRVELFVCFIIILLSRQSNGCCIFWTIPHSLKCCRFPSFPLGSLTSFRLFAACSKLLSRDNCRRAPYPRTQNAIEEDRRWT